VHKTVIHLDRFGRDSGLFSGFSVEAGAKRSLVASVPRQLLRFLLRRATNHACFATNLAGVPLQQGALKALAWPVIFNHRWFVRIAVLLSACIPTRRGACCSLCRGPSRNTRRFVFISNNTGAGKTGPYLGRRYKAILTPNGAVLPATC
jgi:hypothetical protein